MKNYIYYFIGLGLIIAGAIYFGYKSTMPLYSKDDSNRPVAEMTEKSFNFGKINVQEIKRHDFTIINSGKSDLTLGQVSTSCDCTYAYIIIDHKQSPKFTMHGMNSWQGTIKPGKSAILQIIYQPSIMPVHGMVERFVTVATNDPASASLEAKIIAEVN